MLAATRFSLIWTLACCGMLMGGCGKSGDKKPSTQVAATVNGEDITVHQINRALARAGRISPEQTRTASRQVLEQLIDQQLLIEKAVEKNLERDPDVLNAIETSRRQILAQAYVEKSVVAAATQPGNEEIKKFFDEHPELFTQRRIYRFQQLVANVDKTQAAALRAETEKSKNLNDIAAWLRKNNIAFNVSSTVQGAEQLPLDALPRLSKMKDGDWSVTQNDKQFTILQLSGSQQVPLSQGEATPYIQQFLTNQRRTELARSELKRLRESARVEYRGEFLKPEGAAPQPDKAAPASKPSNPFR